MSRVVLYIAVVFSLSSCTLRSDGAYIRGHGSNELFAPVHSGAVKALSPSLDRQYCYGMGNRAQEKTFEKERDIEVYNSQLTRDDLKYEYEFLNKCQ